MKARPLVEVEWCDAGARGQWASCAEYAQMQPVECRSVGYVIKRGVKHIILAQSHNCGKGECSDGIVIPRALIHRIRSLKYDGPST